MIARAIFILCPAALVGMVGLIFHPAIAAVFFLAVAWWGYAATQPHPERGEHR